MTQPHIVYSTTCNVAHEVLLQLHQFTDIRCELIVIVRGVLDKKIELPVTDFLPHSCPSNHHGPAQTESFIAK